MPDSVGTGENIMSVFFVTLNQTAVLLTFIAAGYILSRLKAVPENAEAVLSKLENNLLIPALVLGTFIESFTREKLSEARDLFLGSLILGLIMILLAMVCVRLCTKDQYLRKIFLYGLSFANFGFMGNAVVKALFPHMFMEYLIFVLPFWMLIYVWGVPTLLIPSDGGKKSVKERLKAFINPMMIGMVIGMVIGLINPPMPAFLGSAVSTLGSCMSPIAMLLTGMTIAKIDLKATFKNLSIYIVSLIRLLAFPLVFVLLFLVIKLPYGMAACIVCCLAMPLGLNTIVVPNAYGMDTSVAAGMTLISHLLSCLTIPVVFLLFDLVML